MKNIFLIIISSMLFLVSCSKKKDSTSDASNIITTVVGNSGYPYGVAVDHKGNVYIADGDQNVIRKIDSTGTSYVIAGNGYNSGVTNGGGYSGDGGQATDAELWTPNDVAVDADGNVYIADMGNRRIRKVNTAGIITTIIGNGLPGYSGDGGSASAATLNLPYSLSIDASGNLYFADYFENCIRKINTSNVVTTVVGGTTTSTQLYEPTGVSVDANNNIYIVDNHYKRICKVNTAGSMTVIAGNTTAGYSGDGGTAINASFRSPRRIATDNKGNIFISDDENNVIRKINSAGMISTFAGNGFGAGTGNEGGYSGDGGLATNAQLWEPDAVAVDVLGNVYIADGRNNVIRKVNK